MVLRVASSARFRAVAAAKLLFFVEVGVDVLWGLVVAMLYLWHLTNAKQVALAAAALQYGSKSPHHRSIHTWMSSTHTSLSQTPECGF